MDSGKDRRFWHAGVTAFGVAAASLLFYYLIFHMGQVKQAAGTAIGILMPILYAAVLAYLLWPVVSFLERRIIDPPLRRRKIVPGKKAKKMIRMVCVLVTFLLLFSLVYALLAMLIPEIAKSIMNIAENSPRYLENAREWLNKLLKDYPELEENSALIFNMAAEKLQGWMTDDLLPWVNNLLVNFTTGFISVLSFFKNFVIGALISVYLLCSKEAYVAQGKRVCYAVCGVGLTNRIIRDLQYVDVVFGEYIRGQLADAAFVGVSCYIGSLFLNLPYGLLISVIVGVTNVIPYFGPYLGAVPSAFLILLVNPIRALYFIIFIVVLQQVDGNLIAPRIIGSSTGLSGFLVIVSILLGGGFFGIPGMLLGVPVCAVLCTMMHNLLARRLEKKGLPTEPAAYVGVDHLNRKTGETVYPPGFEEKSYLDSLRKLFSRIKSRMAQKKP